MTTTMKNLKYARVTHFFVDTLYNKHVLRQTQTLLIFVTTLAVNTPITSTQLRL